MFTPEREQLVMQSEHYHVRPKFARLTGTPKVRCRQELNKPMSTRPVVTVSSTDLACERKCPVLERAHNIRFSQGSTMSARLFTTHAKSTPAANEGAPYNGHQRFFKKSRQSGRVQLSDVFFLDTLSVRILPRLQNQRVTDLQENPEQFPSSLSQIIIVQNTCTFLRTIPRMCADKSD